MPRHRKHRAGKEYPSGPHQGVSNVLAALFDILALNLALLLTALPIVTLPVAISAAYAALDRRSDGTGGGILRDFLSGLRSRPFLQTTIVTGIPLLAVALGVVEVSYFASSQSFIGEICLGFGVTALVATSCALGYIFLLASRSPSSPALQVWSLGFRLGVASLLRTGPMFIAEVIGAALLLLLDPLLIFLGVPALLLQLMCWTSRLGLRSRPSPP